MNALSKPWLVSYLIAFANTLENKTLPPDAKPKTIQIIKFLTGPTPQEPEPKSYWAQVSDGEHHISSWISDDAASKFCQSRGCRLSSTQTGVFVIRSYRPTLERLAPPTPGSPAEWSQRVILEIMDIELLGSERDPPFGSPKPALNHEEIQKVFTQRPRSHSILPQAEQRPGELGTPPRSVLLHQAQTGSHADRLQIAPKFSWDEDSSDYFMDDIQPPLDVMLRLRDIWKEQTIAKDPNDSSIPNRFYQPSQSQGISPIATVAESQVAAGVSFHQSSSPEIFFSDWEPTLQPTITQESMTLRTGEIIFHDQFEMRNGISSPSYSPSDPVMSSNSVDAHGDSKGERDEANEIIKDLSGPGLKRNLADTVKTQGEKKEDSAEDMTNQRAQSKQENCVGLTGQIRSSGPRPIGQGLLQQSASSSSSSMRPRLFSAWTSTSALNRHLPLKQHRSRRGIKFGGADPSGSPDTTINHDRNKKTGPDTIPEPRLQTSPSGTILQRHNETSIVGRQETALKSSGHPRKSYPIASLEGQAEILHYDTLTAKPTHQPVAERNTRTLLDIRHQAVGYEHLILRKVPSY